MVALVAMIVGCTSTESSDSGLAQPTQAPPIKPSPFSNMNTYVTHPANRYVFGTSRLPVEPLQIELSATFSNPLWFVGAPGSKNVSESSIVWGIVAEDGRWTTFQIENSELSKTQIASPLEETWRAPPFLVVDDSGRADLSVNAVASTGDLVMAAALSDIENVPDALTVIGSDGTLYSFSGPTERYPHGALGDRIEWGELVAFQQGDDRNIKRFKLDPDDVFEGLFPLLADLDGDGRDEVIATVSSSNSGSRLIAFAYDEDGLRVIAESDPIGTGFRWLHQIAAAPLGPNGEIEIAVVKTPHIGGVAQFYRLKGNRLEIVASNSGGYMSHVNGSRNLDQAVAGDFDGDGNVELLLPSRDQKTLVALRRVGDTVEKVWELPLGSRLATNITTVESANGAITVGAVTEDGTLLIWQ